MCGKRDKERDSEEPGSRKEVGGRARGICALRGPILRSFLSPTLSHVLPDVELRLPGSEV